MMTEHIAFQGKFRYIDGISLEDAFEFLKGRPLNEVCLDARKERIAFIFEDGTIDYFQVEGGCCSNSWVEHFTLPDKLKGKAIVDVTQTYLGSTERPEDYLKSYETRFRTSHGDIVLEYRNSSNGMYGAELTPVVRIPEGDWPGKLDKQIAMGKATKQHRH